jgi:hypothetical protein
LKLITLVAAAFVVFAAIGPASALDGHRQTVTPQFNQTIPNMPGKSLVVVEVDYAPGAASASHKHARSAFIYAYVLAGEVESKVSDGDSRIYRAGESWSGCNPLDQPKRKQDQAGEAARGLCRRLRRQAAYYPLSKETTR